jgi:Na+/H+-dicarboxylate symporter
MPWTIEGTARNLQNKNLAKVIIPATTNIQQVGDCIVNAFLCFLIYRNFLGYNPDLYSFGLNLPCVFVLARFVTAAILGWIYFHYACLFMKTYLDFNPEMIAIILALNVVLDPLVTSCNVIANGALCRVFEVCMEQERCYCKCKCRVTTIEKRSPFNIIIY